MGAAFGTLVGRVDGALKRAVGELWSITQLEEFLNGGGVGLEEYQNKLLLRVWHRQQDKVARVVEEAARFGNTLLDLSWRVDQQAASKSEPELDAASCIVELLISNENKAAAARQAALRAARASAEPGDAPPEPPAIGATHDVVTFEMDAAQLEQTLLQVRAIKSFITSQTVAGQSQDQAADDA